MKLIQFIGTRNKTDFIIYFSHILTKLDKRVLIVDQTQNQLYRHGYTRLEEEQNLFDFQGIDILCGMSSWPSLNNHLSQTNESVNDYDVVIFDMDSTTAIKGEWPTAQDRFYVGDFERLHQQRDMSLIRTLFHVTGSKELKRITFENRYKLDDSYFAFILGEEVLWRSDNYLVEPDEIVEDLRIQMQHEQEIPFNKLARQYKDVLIEMISSLFEMHVKDIANAVKPSYFKFKFKRTVSKEKLETSKV